MEVEDFLLYIFWVMCVIFFVFTLYEAGKKNGKKEFKEMIFRNTLEDYQIMSLEKGFETYYIKINRLEKKDVVCKTNGMGNKYTLKEEK